MLIAALSLLGCEKEVVASNWIEYSNNHCINVPNQVLEVDDAAWDMPGEPDLEGYTCNSYTGPDNEFAETLCEVYTCQADCTLTFLKPSQYAHLYPCG